MVKATPQKKAHLGKAPSNDTPTQSASIGLEQSQVFPDDGQAYLSMDDLPPWKRTGVSKNQVCDLLQCNYNPALAMSSWRHNRTVTYWHGCHTSRGTSRSFWTWRHPLTQGSACHVKEMACTDGLNASIGPCSAAPVAERNTSCSPSTGWTNIRKLGRCWHDQTNLTNRSQHDING